MRTPTSCDIFLPETRETIADVQQHQLETAVPRTHHARVLLLRGAHARQQGRLLQREADGSVTVQLLSDFTIMSVGFDDVAEYVGDQGEDE